MTTASTLYNGEIVVSVRVVRMRSDGVVKTIFCLIDLQFLVPLSYSPSSSSSALASRTVGAQMLSARRWALGLSIPAEFVVEHRVVGEFV